MSDSPQTATGGTRAVAYARVSTGAQADSGLGVAAQHRAIASAAAERGWELVGAYTDDAVSATIEPAQRPQLQEALEELASGRANMLVAARLDRFVRSMRDLMTLLDLADGQGWQLLSLDVLVDPDTPIGSFLRTVLGAFAELDRAVISERTTAALSVARSQGTRLGRPCRQPQGAKDLAVAMHAEGHSYRQIGTALQQQGLRTATGCDTWHAATVRSLINSARLDAQAAANKAAHQAAQRYASSDST